jgi:DNA (cytosine-5)-methyltransferase 1
MGPRKGLKGARSGLFFEYARLIEQRTPRVVVIENVSGLRSSHGGRDFETVIRTLAEIGYGVAWRVLNSRYFGVPQSRERVFIVGMHRDPQAAGRILFESECGERDDPTRRPDGTKAASPFKAILGDPRTGPLVKGIAHCVYAESARHTGTDWSRNYVSYPEGRVRRLVPVENERLQGFPDDWTLPDDTSLEDKLDSARYRAIGNAVTVNVAEWLGDRIRKVLSQHSLRCDICGTRAPTQLPLESSAYAPSEERVAAAR